MENNNDFKESLRYPRIYEIPGLSDIHEELMQVLDEYERNNTFENREFLCYLTSAIYLTYRKLYPQLALYIPFRTKADMSCIQNIQKEFKNFAKDYENEEPFDTAPITKDMSGLKIILDNINFSLPSTEESDQLFNDPEIKKLMGNEGEKGNENPYSRQKNFAFIDKINNYISAPIQSGKQYFELKKELLDRILHTTPSEFTNERKPYPSYAELYEKSLEDYNYFLENDNFPTNISAGQITDLKELLNDFRSKIDDKLQFAILRKTLPIVFEQPLIKNVLQTSFSFEKEPLKPNGFQAIYYTLQTPFGPIEVQSQSNRANYVALKGSAYHSGLTGKSINIRDFFELVNPNDEHELSFYLDQLDSTSADKMVSPYELPAFKTEEEKNEFLKTQKGIAFLNSEKYREMMKHIQIKKELTLFYEYLPEDVCKKYKIKRTTKLQELIANGKIPANLQDLIASGEIPTVKMDTTEYLLSTSLSVSPYMNVCSSGHTSFTTAGIHHKKVIGEFSEILRKRDSNTCLRDMLIRELERIIENPPENPSPAVEKYLKIIKEHDDTATKLPKDISQKNIINFAEKLRAKQKDTSELDFVI